MMAFTNQIDSDEINNDRLVVYLKGVISYSDDTRDSFYVSVDQDNNLINQYNNPLVVQDAYPWLQRLLEVVGCTISFNGPGSGKQVTGFEGCFAGFAVDNNGRHLFSTVITEKSDPFAPFESNTDWLYIFGKWSSNIDLMFDSLVGVNVTLSTNGDGGGSDGGDGGGPIIPSYIGHPAISGLSSITPKITCHRISGSYPFLLAVSGEQTTCNAGNSYIDLHYSWEFDIGETEAVTTTSQITGQLVDLSTDQVGPEAQYLFWEPGTYGVTLTVSGKDENGNTVSASTSTVLRLGEYRFFNGIASGGTFTLTVNGQTTDPIAYNATDVQIVAELEALSSVGVGNVRSTGYAHWQFCGALAGQSITHTANSSGLTGTTGTPKLIEAFAPSSNTDIVVHDMSEIDGWEHIHFDSNAAGGGDGSINSPYNSASTLLSMAHSDQDMANNQSKRVYWIHDDSSFDLNGTIKWSRSYTEQKIISYANNSGERNYIPEGRSGNKPIIVNTGTTVQGEILYITADRDSPDVWGQHAVCGIDLRFFSERVAIWDIALFH